MATETKLANFSERCRQESTRDVIFLFQRRRWTVIACPEDHEFDDEGRCVPEGDWEGEELTPAELSKEVSGDYDVPCTIETWETERVFLTRDEAEKYGRERHYNYRDGWRAYGIPAEGQLAELIKST